MIGICGLGVVGNAVYKVFQHYHINCYGYDKYKKIGKKEDLLSCDYIFLCLPTPFHKYKKEFDKQSLHITCKFLQKKAYKGIVIIKSTVEPGTCREFVEKYGLKIVHNPEFLSAKTAYQDFLHQTHIVLGGERSLCLQIHSFYKIYWTCKYSLCSWEESEAMKLCCNSFYAVKIQFFNEIYSYLLSNHISYEKVLAMMLENGWIHPQHTKVPGTDRELSYGGMCFPKDTNALCEDMKRNNTLHHVLEACIQERDTIRNS